MNSPGWIEFIGDRKVNTDEEAQNYLLNGPIKSYADYGFGLWLVELLDLKISIGMCGLIKRPGLDFVDLGFAFLPQFTKKGYALEISKATLNYAEQKLNTNIIKAITTSTNSSSISLLRKLGFLPEGTIILPKETEELLLYKLKIK